MTQLALTRKWRPRHLTALVGQAPTVKILTRALNTVQLHHAYLFTGTRGVGKTTLARILAKCLNCETGISAEPCEICPTCTAMNAGNCVDLMEIDAASRTKVEDTRELLEHVAYAPVQARFKIYLIDEVHMLSNHSFNALLKTLEEPPAHVKFLFATTEPQKLPVTVLSRCLQFHLRPVPLSDMIALLAYIAEQEGVAYEPLALTEMARAAQGSLRDAEGLLEQAMLYRTDEEPIRVEDVRVMLGLVPRQRVLVLLKALADKDVDRLLQAIAELHDLAPNYEAILAELLAVLHQITVAQLAPKTVDTTLPEYGDLLTLMKAFLAEEVQLYYDIGLMGQKQLPYAPEPRIGFEMILLRMLAFRPGHAAKVQVPQTVKIAVPVQAQHRAPVNMVPMAEKRIEKPIEKPSSSPVHMGEIIPIDVVTVASIELEGKKAWLLRWQQLIAQLGIQGLLKQIADNCVVHHWTDKHIDLWLDESQRPLFQKRHELELQKRLTQQLQRSLTLKITFHRLDTLPDKSIAQVSFEQHQIANQQAVQQIQADTNIQTWVNDFQASVESIESTLDLKTEEVIQDESL
jgi:DNA polymerase-3 subunit gamma/tau